MRYANIADPVQREQAHRAIRDRVQLQVRQPPQYIPQPPHREPQPPIEENPRGNQPQPPPQERRLAWQQPEARIEENPRDDNQARPPPQDLRVQLDPPIDPPDDNDLPPLYHEDDNDNPGEIRPENPGLNGVGAQNIPVPPVQAGRRPIYALARENAEALNVLLTRDLPVLTNQMQQAIEQLNELMRRQMENQM